MVYLTTTDRKPRSIINQLTRQVRLAYYRNEVTYGLYVMSPAEKWILNGFVLTFLTFLLLAVYFYLPDFVSQLVKRLVWMYGGSPELDVVMEGVPEAFMALQL